jgi:hypothetical protein
MDVSEPAKNFLGPGTKVPLTNSLGGNKDIPVSYTTLLVGGSFKPALHDEGFRGMIELAPNSEVHWEEQ